MEKRIELITKAIEEKNGKNIIVVKLNTENRVFDFVVLATGSSNRNIQAITDEIVQQLKESNVFKFSGEGYQEANWVLLDFSDIVVHIFDKETREYYDLENLFDGNEIIYEK